MPKSQTQAAQRMAQITSVCYELVVLPLQSSGGDIIIFCPSYDACHVQMRTLYHNTWTLSVQNFCEDTTKNIEGLSRNYTMPTTLMTIGFAWFILNKIYKKSTEN